MAKRDFDLAAAISGIVSNSNTGAPEVKMIPIGDIIPNPANFYKVDMEALKPLMDSIAMDGLHHYPLVMKHPEQEGKWQLIDGERRYTACKALLDEGNENFATIPCTVKEYGSTALAELQLILSNSTNRILNGIELAKQAEKTEMLFYQLKEEGYEFPGRMRDQVAAACNVSATKLAKLKVIREKLIEEFTEQFEKNLLSEQAAYALARLPAEFQSRIAQIQKGEAPEGHKVEKILKRYEDGWRWDAKDLKCLDGKACGGADRFLGRDLKCANWEGLCGGNKCCLTCDLASASYGPCERMCSKAKARRQEKKAAQDAKAAAEKLKRAKPLQLETMKNAQRLLKAIDAVGLPDDVLVPWQYYGLSSNARVEDIRKWADGDFENSGEWYAPRLGSDKLEKALEACKVLKCSADFLLGLTDELDGGHGLTLKWKSPEEKPKPHVEVVAKFTLPGLIKPKIMVANWNGVRWCFPHGAVIDAQCVGWWPIPEDE